MSKKDGRIIEFLVVVRISDTGIWICNEIEFISSIRDQCSCILRIPKLLELSRSLRIYRSWILRNDEENQNKRQELIATGKYCGCFIIIHSKLRIGIEILEISHHEFNWICCYSYNLTQFLALFRWKTRLRASNCLLDRCEKFYYQILCKTMCNQLRYFVQCELSRHQNCSISFHLQTSSLVFFGAVFRTSKNPLDTSWIFNHEPRSFGALEKYLSIRITLFELNFSINLERMQEILILELNK